MNIFEKLLCDFLLQKQQLPILNLFSLFLKDFFYINLLPEQIDVEQLNILEGMKNKNYVRLPFLLMLLVLVGAMSFAQTPGGKFVVKGVVTDEQGEPLIGATVLLKSKNVKIQQGTVTDFDGVYSIEITSGEDQLEFSYVSYKTVNIPVGNQREINVSLQPDSKLLDDIVVTGYQTISRERVTGSFTRITAESMEQQRPASLSSLLEGRIAGYNSSGLIRGTTSMSGLTNPLFVIDGFPIENTRYNSDELLVENFPDLNLEDIESITVLKDAAATSIYGARAANGVVVIVTRKAAKGKTSIGFSSMLTLSSKNAYKKHLIDSRDLIDIEREWANSNANLQGDGAQDYAQSILDNAIYTNQGIQSILNFYTNRFSESEMNDRLTQLAAQGYRYQEDVEKYAKRTPIYQQHNLNIGKSTDSNSFYASMTYRNNQYADKYTNDEAIGLNINNSTQITSWLKLDLGTYLNYKNGDTQQYNPYSPGYTYMPYDGLVNEDGSYYTSTPESRMSIYTQDILNKYNFYSMDITPLEELGKNIGKTRNLNVRAFAKLDIKLADWISYNAMFQYENGNDRYEVLNQKDSYSVRNRVNSLASYTAEDGFKFNLPYGNILYEQNQQSDSYNFRQQLNLHKLLAEKHDITAIIGSETRHQKLLFSQNSLYNYDPDMLSFELIDAASLANVRGSLLGGSFSTNDIARKREIMNRFISVYGNAAYTFNDTYMLTGSLRWDRSNLWGTNSKYQNKPLWSLGAGWNVHKEEFFNVNWVDMLKMRMSYGIGGNIAKNAAPYMTASYYPNTSIGGMYGQISSRPNPDLTWEKTTTLNVGVDFSLFKNRLTGSFDLYNKQGTDLLANTMGVPTEGFGYSTYKINNGEMYNRGLEISLSYDVIRNADFFWNASLLYAYNKNKVTYVNVKAPMYILQLDYPSSYPIIGNPYNAIYGYKWAGLNEKGLPTVLDENGERTTEAPATLDAIHYLGSTVPTHSGSFGSTLGYKSFEFSFLMLFEAGHKMRNTNLPFLGSKWVGAIGGYMTDIATVNRDITQRWRNPGDEAKTDIPRLVFAHDPDFNYGSHSVYSYADINVLNASNLRMRNISLAYTLPKQLTKKLFMERVKLQFNIENLFTIAADHNAKYMLGGYNSPNYVWALHVNF